MKTQIIEPVTIADAARTIAQSADIYFSRDDWGNYRMDRRRARPICLIGPAGIGKTEVVRQVAEEKGLAFLSYSITHHTRQSAIGLPRLAERVMDGVTVSVTEYTMSEIIAEVYRVMEDTGKKEGILFLDEFNCASETMRPLMLQLLQAKTFGPHAIPDGWMLVLAGNPPEYNRSVSELDAVTADRLRMLYIEPNYGVWREYAVKKGIHPLILSYLDSHKGEFYHFERKPEGTALVTARGWEDLSVFLGYVEELHQELDLPLVGQYLQSGPIARSFMAYYRQYRSLIATGMAQEILDGVRLEAHAETVREGNFTANCALASILLDHLESLADQACRQDRTADAVHQVLLTLKDAPDRALSLAEQIDQVENRPARAFLAGCIELTGLPDGWDQLKKRFQNEVLRHRQAAFRRAADSLDHTLCCLELAGETAAPVLEFVLNGVSSSAGLSQVIAQAGSEMYSRLAQAVLFGDSRTDRALSQAVRAAG